MEGATEGLLISAECMLDEVLEVGGRAGQYWSGYASGG